MLDGGVPGAYQTLPHVYHTYSPHLCRGLYVSSLATLELFSALHREDNSSASVLYRMHLTIRLHGCRPGAQRLIAIFSSLLFPNSSRILSLRFPAPRPPSDYRWANGLCHSLDLRGDISGQHPAPICRKSHRVRAARGLYPDSRRHTGRAREAVCRGE